MTTTASAAVKPVFVKVTGFADEDRLAFASALANRTGAAFAYEVWSPRSLHAAEVAVLDGESWEAAIELANPANRRLDLVWVGGSAPSRARLVVAHPVNWPSLVEQMDSLLNGGAVAPVPAASAASAAGACDLDLDLLSPPAETASGAVPDIGSAADADAVTAPSPLAPVAVPVSPAAQALIIDADRDARLYLRAKLSMVGLMYVDEAASAAEALQLVNTRLYSLVVFDLAPELGGWPMVKTLMQSRPVIRSVVLTGLDVSWVDKLRGWFAGAKGCLRKPLHPRRLKRLLRNLQA